MIQPRKPTDKDWETERMAAEVPRGLRQAIAQYLANHVTPQVYVGGVQASGNGGSLQHDNDFPILIIGINQNRSMRGYADHAVSFMFTGYQMLGQTPAAQRDYKAKMDRMYDEVWQKLHAILDKGAVKPVYDKNHGAYFFNHVNDLIECINAAEPDPQKHLPLHGTYAAKVMPNSDPRQR